jgi:3-methyladenine DNA glycosylase AlkD
MPKKNKYSQIKKYHHSVLLVFKENANPNRAIEQQRYMRSKLPFYGIPSPLIKKIVNNKLTNFPILSNQVYRKTIQYFFANAEFREEWYVGLHIALKHKEFIMESNLNLYLNLILRTQWWDIVDTVATNLIGPAINSSSKFKSLLNSWIKHNNMWIRRTAILCQLKYKLNTNENLLYKMILTCSGEKEFFIRKAIGWALREHSKTNPKSVRQFIKKNSFRLSPLSIREGMKRMK